MNDFKIHLSRTINSRKYLIISSLIHHEALCKIKLGNTIPLDDLYARNIKEVTCELCLRLFKLELFS